MSLTITAALIAVRDPATGATHLVASSPALPGGSPDQPPLTALCGQRTGTPAPDVPAWDVDCGECVQLVGPYLELPGWGTP